MQVDKLSISYLRFQFISLCLVLCSFAGLNYCVSPGSSDYSAHLYVTYMS